MTHRLVELGHPVVAVDQSSSMLAHVRGAQTVLADIETLHLGRRFRAVVLASQFVNLPDHVRRRRILEACARHVAGDGIVLIQRHDPAWNPRAGDVVTGVLGRARITTRVAARRGTVVDAEATYDIDGHAWHQRYSAELLDDPAAAASLQDAGLELDRVLRPRTWLAARRRQPR
jgi:hypothetical protein